MLKNAETGRPIPFGTTPVNIPLLEEEAGLKDLAEVTRCRNLVQQHAAALNSRLNLSIIDPLSISNYAIIVSRPLFVQWLKKNGYPAFVSAMCRKGAETPPQDHLIASKELLESGYGGYKTCHEITHAVTSDECPTGLREGGAEYCAFLVYGDSSQKRQAYWQNDVSTVDTATYLEVTTIEFPTYDAQREIFEQLCRSYGQKTMLDCIFFGLDKGLDNIPDQTRRSQLIEIMNSLDNASRENGQKRLQAFKHILQSGTC